MSAQDYGWVTVDGVTRRRYLTPFTFDELNAVFDYRQDGHLYWRRGKGLRAGYRAGYEAEGYWVITRKGIDMEAHRVIWLLCKGEWPPMDLDHIDRNPLNNRIGNLRLATSVQNRVNRAPRSKTGYTGVYSRPGGRFEASHELNDKEIYLGVFDTAEEAARVRDKAVYAIYGDYVYLNFPREVVCQPTT